MSLRARLLAGLLAVTTFGLIVLSVVSVLVLREYLLRRLDDQLKLAATQIARSPALWQDEARTQIASTYTIAVLNVETGRARLDVGEESALARAAERLGAQRIVLQPFTVDASRDMRAAAAPTRGGRRIVIVAVPLDELRDQLRSLAVTEVVTGAVLIILLALAGRALIGRGLVPLTQMASTAERITRAEDLSARMPAGPAEVGRLGAAINMMLARLQQAFAARWASEERVRRFAADASHELRTPLTTIRGYAELYRQGAIDQDQLPQVMARIEGEADRMTTLVGELLDLARLDRGGAALDLSTTDLVPIAREVVADATALDLTRSLTLSAPDSLIALVDEARIRQVLVNLLANVRVHTPGGTNATVRLSHAGHGGVVIEVADDGPGMRPDEAARAFDRFQRGSAAATGSGLGLAIIQAIAVASGGRATLFTAPGQGTTVRVELPGVDRPTQE